MKSKDFSVIAVVAIVSGVISIFISGALFSTPDDRKESVEVAPAIQAGLELPSKEYYNELSVNPARDVEIGHDPNSNPFDGVQ